MPESPLCSYANWITLRCQFTDDDSYKACYVHVTRQFYSTDNWTRVIRALATSGAAGEQRVHVGCRTVDVNSRRRYGSGSPVRRAIMQQQRTSPRLQL